MLNIKASADKKEGFWISGWLSDDDYIAFVVWSRGRENAKVEAIKVECKA